MFWSRLKAASRWLLYTGAGSRQRAAASKSCSYNSNFKQNFSKAHFSLFPLQEVCFVPCTSCVSKMSVFSSGRKVIVFFGGLVSCVHLTAMGNEVKGAFSASVRCLSQRAVGFLGCLYYLSRDFMSPNNKLLAQPCHWGLSHFVCQHVHVLFFTQPCFTQPIACSFKTRFANSIAMLEITKEGANGCGCYCKPDFHRPSRAWHVGGKFSNGAPAVAAVPKQSGLCCQPGAEAGASSAAASCKAQAALAPSGAFPEGPGVVLSSAGLVLGEPRKLWG